jgi:hypothetical protein
MKKLTLTQLLHVTALLALFACFATPALAQTKLVCDDTVTCGTGADMVVGDDLNVLGDVVSEGTKGVKYTLSWVTAETAALTSGGTANCGSSLIPAGSTVYGCVTRVTTLITGATSIDVGDGTDADRWGDNEAVTAGTVVDGDEFTAGDPVWYAAATNVVYTANGSNFTAGKVRCACLIGRLTPPTN